MTGWPLVLGARQSVTQEGKGMLTSLTTTRKLDESLVIDTSDGPITVTVAGVLGGRAARLRVTAPEEVVIRRRELLDQPDPKQRRRRA